MGLKINNKTKHKKSLGQKCTYTPKTALLGDISHAPAEMPSFSGFKWHDQEFSVNKMTIPAQSRAFQTSLQMIQNVLFWAFVCVGVFSKCLRQQLVQRWHASLKWKTLFRSQYLIFLFCQVEQTRENTLPAFLTDYLLYRKLHFSLCLLLSVFLLISALSPILSPFLRKYKHAYSIIWLKKSLFLTSLRAAGS